jgi:HSP20 family protein
MNIWTWRPGWDPLGELQRHVDRLFDFTNQPGNLWPTGRQHPAFNIYETPTEYVLAAPLPGVKAEDVDVTVVGKTITLKGERKRDASVADEAYRRQERWLGKWSRTVQAPEKVDLDKLGASLENGVLILRLPKAVESQPRHVPVQVNQSRQAGVPA